MLGKELVDAEKGLAIITEQNSSSITPAIVYFASKGSIDAQAASINIV